MKAKSIKVLLADDTLIAREGWKKILETADDIVVVGEVTLAHETPHKVLELQPDILLMDLKWFGDDTAGWTAIKEIKSSFPSTKVVAVTAYENLIHDARMAGADAALTKTFTRDDLLGLIRELAARSFNFQVPETKNTHAELTTREHEVLLLMAKGYSDRDIADTLGIAATTAKNHVKKVLDKLGAKNRTQAVAFGRDSNLIR
jgi:DNA-binding NarL/FixJ family response regulator